MFWGSLDHVDRPSWQPLSRSQPISQQQPPDMWMKRPWRSLCLQPPFEDWSSAGTEFAYNAGDGFDSWIGKIPWRRERLPTPVFLGFPGGSAGKEPAHNAGSPGSIPGLGRSPGEGKGYPLQYSDLENSMDCIVHGVTKSPTWLSDFHFPVHPQNYEKWWWLL